MRKKVLLIEMENKEEEEVVEAILNLMEKMKRGEEKKLKCYYGEVWIERKERKENNEIKMEANGREGEEKNGKIKSENKLISIKYLNLEEEKQKRGKTEEEKSGEETTNHSMEEKEERHSKMNKFSSLSKFSPTLIKKRKSEQTKKKEEEKVNDEKVNEEKMNEEKVNEDKMKEKEEKLILKEEETLFNEEFLLGERETSHIIMENTTTMYLPKETSWITIKASYGKYHVLSSFPDHLFLYIFSFLDLKTLVRVAQVCTEWRRLTNDRRLWKGYYKRNFKKQKNETNRHHFDQNNQKDNKNKSQNNNNENEMIEIGEEKEFFSFDKESTMDWKERVKKMFILDRNWKTGEFVANNLRGHTSLVTGLDFNSNKLVSSSYDGTVRLWNTQTGNTLLVLSNNINTSPINNQNVRNFLNSSPPPPVWCLKFAKDEQRVFTGSGDSKIRVWDLTTTKCVAQYRKHLGGVKCLQLDDEKIITGSDDKTVKIFDIKSGQCVKTIQQGGAVSSLCFHQNILFTATKMSPKINCYDTRTGNLLHEFSDGHRKAVYSLFFNPNTNILASGGRDKQIVLWDINNFNNHNNIVKKFQGHRYSVMTLQMDEEKIVSGSADNTIRIWDLVSGSCRQILHQGHNQMITALKFDEEKIVSGSADRTLIVADFTMKSTKEQTKFDFFS